MGVEAEPDARSAPLNIVILQGFQGDGDHTMKPRHPNGSITRRRFLTSSMLAATVILAACAQAPAEPTAAPTAAAPPTTAPAAPTAASAQPTPAAPPTAVPAAPTQAPAPTAQPATATPAAAASGSAKQIPRERTLVVIGAGREGQMYDYDLWNPYAVGANHQTGSNLVVEPLSFYSAFADKEIPWLAESYEYNSDFTQLTLKLRTGVKWSDGELFSADDVAYTLNTLRDLGPKVRWGVDAQQYVKEAKATDPTTVTINLTVPAPRFMDFMMYKYDIGVYIIPKHIFQNQDWTTFKHFDPAKGWPVTTGPWRIPTSSQQQKVFELADDWWAVKAGLTAMPKIQRMIYLPITDQSAQAQSIISNQVDYVFMPVQEVEAAVQKNPAVTTHAGRQGPFGYVDWWPLSLYVNNTVKPFDDPEIRWAISYYLNRQQIIDAGYGPEAGVTPSRLPLPEYPPLLPYFDAVKDLLAKYDTTKFDAVAGDAIMTKKGWKKDGSGMWVDPQGNRLKLPILGFSFLASAGPVVSEGLKKRGIDASYSMPPDAGDRFTKGDYIACIYGHGGSIRDPYATLRLYQSATLAVPGAHEVNFPKWTNADYDKIVDAVYNTPMDQKEKLQQLFHKAMEIWLPQLPDIQLVKFYHNIALNTTYWKGWPSNDNNYVNEASWHLTWQLVLNKLEPTK
jgi:peptide/nickel transport system substrate-binding protein